jgi:hypothetical protein
MTIEFRKEDRDFFWENGYLLYKNFYPVDQVSKVIDFIDRLDFDSIEPRYLDSEPGVKTAVYQFLHEQKNCLGDLSNHQSLIDYTAFLMGDDTYVWSSKINFKSPWHGRAEYWHADYIYWKERGYKNDNMLTAMTFLDSHSIENAALHILPKSHKIDEIEHVDFIDVNGLAKKMVHIETMENLNKENPIIRIEAEIGDVSFHHASTIHGSSHNIGPLARKVLFSQLNTESNLPEDGFIAAKNFNLKRVKFEIEQLEKRLEESKNKYETQLSNTKEIMANSPISSKEK